MNIQAMMKQAQKLQNDMLKAKKEIDETTFIGESSFVKVEVKGDKKISKVEIMEKQLYDEDIEMLQDILVVALNDAMTKIDKVTEEKMGKYTQGMPGIF